jgi:acyl-coenzyme A thioesterase PaaI-like protein
MNEGHQSTLVATIEEEPGWLAADPLFEVGAIRSFVSGDPAGDRIRVRYFKRKEDGALVGKVWFGPGAEGPPGHAHGGSMAAVLDEALGAAAWMAGHPVVAAKLTTVFRRMLPLGSTVLLEASVQSVKGRKLSVSGRLLSPTGEAFAEADGIFIEISFEHLRNQQESCEENAK